MQAVVPAGSRNVSGVKTVYWGAHAWTMIHSLASHFDEIRDSQADEQGVPGEDELDELIAEFWSCVAAVLPCHLCRSSCEVFVKEIGLEMRGSTTVEQAFALHERVNLKLFSQDIMRHSTSKDWIKSCIDRWEGYQLAKCVRKKTRPVSSREFLNSTFYFCLYMVADFDSERAETIIYFFFLIGKILKAYPQNCTSVSDTWQSSLALIPRNRARWTELRSRVQIVFEFFCSVLVCTWTSFPVSLDVVNCMVQNAVVFSNKPTRVSSSATQKNSISIKK